MTGPQFNRWFDTPVLPGTNRQDQLAAYTIQLTAMGGGTIGVCYTLLPRVHLCDSIAFRGGFRTCLLVQN